jgi:hypothetical protein
MMKGLHESDEIRSIGPALNPERPLSHRWKTHLWTQECCNTIPQPEPLQTGRSEDDGRVLVLIQLS